MCGKCVALWCCVFSLFFVSSSLLRPNFMSDDKEKNYSTIRYQPDATTMRYYEKKKDSIWYNLHENSTKDYSDIHYTHSNFMSNNREDDDMIQYKFRAHENESQISMESHINSTGDKKNFISQEMA